MIGLQAISANLLAAPNGNIIDIVSVQTALAQWPSKHIDARKSIGMVLGFGYDDAQLTEQKHPTRKDLDTVSKDVPMLIIHQSGHIGVMTSKALELAGITADKVNPDGGVIRRETNAQNPNGALEEAAPELLLAAIRTSKAKHPPKDRRAMLIHGQFLRKDPVTTLDELDAMTAQKAMTIWPAYQHFEEGSTGSPEQGKLAGFVILPVDPTTIDPETLHQIKVTETIKGGKRIYCQDNTREKADRALLATSRDIFGRMLSQWQLSNEKSGENAHGHGPELLMSTMLEGLESPQSNVKH